jgi:hypothetical protein
LKICGGTLQFTKAQARSLRVFDMGKTSIKQCVSKMPRPCALVGLKVSHFPFSVVVAAGAVVV